MYEVLGTDIGLTQGDIFSDCPIIDWIRSTPDAWEPQQFTQNVIVLTHEHLAQHFAVTFSRIALPEP